MDNKADNIDNGKSEARKSFTGSNLTDSQFDETCAICEIIDRNIHKSGSFVEKLSDYAHAFARTERFDTLKAEAIIRDIYRARYGEMMNQRRERLTNREAEIKQAAQGSALKQARFVIELIRTEPTMPFYQAYDRAAVTMAVTQGITETGAKEMMKAAFASKEGRELYEAGKEAEQLYHKAARQETAGNERKAETKSRSGRNRSRS